MDRIADLAAILRREVADYAWDEDDSKAYFMQAESQPVYSVLVVPYDNPQDSTTIIVARLTPDNRIAIETDLTDKPLYEALLQAGVPREQIVRAYLGERPPAP